MAFGTAHRLFLQAALSRRCIDETEAKTLMQEATNEADREGSSEGATTTTTTTTLENFVDEVNHELGPLDMEMRRVLRARDGTPLWGLVNLKEDEAIKLATEYTPQEITYFRTLLTSIMTSDNFAYSVASTSALAIGRQMKPALSNTAVEGLLRHLVEAQWLEYRVRSGSYGLGARSLLELAPSFRQGFPDERKDCFLCRELVVEGFRCGQEAESEEQECQGFLHTYCSKAYLARRDICQVCQRPFLPLPVGPDALMAGDPRKRHSRLDERDTLHEAESSPSQDVDELIQVGSGA